MENITIEIKSHQNPGTVLFSHTCPNNNMNVTLEEFFKHNLVLSSTYRISERERERERVIKFSE